MGRRILCNVLLVTYFALIFLFSSEFASAQIPDPKITHKEVLSQGTLECGKPRVVWVSSDQKKCSVELKLKGTKNCHCLVKGHEQQISQGGNFIDARPPKSSQIEISCRGVHRDEADGCEYEIKNVQCGEGRATEGSDDIPSAEEVKCGSTNRPTLYHGNQATVTIRFKCSEGCKAEVFKHDKENPDVSLSANSDDFDKLTTFPDASWLVGGCSGNKEEGKCEFEVTAIEKK